MALSKKKGGKNITWRKGKRVSYQYQRLLSQPVFYWVCCISLFSLTGEKCYHLWPVHEGVPDNRADAGAGSRTYDAGVIRLGNCPSSSDSGPGQEYDSIEAATADMDLISWCRCTSRTTCLAAGQDTRGNKPIADGSNVVSGIRPAQQIFY